MPLNISILGLDALGASLGIALGTLDPKVLDVGRPRITGWDADRKVRETARGRLAVDVAADDLATAVREADVVFVNVAEAQLHQTLLDIGPHLKQGVLVTDTLAVKEPIIALAQRTLPSTAQFVGGHPFVSFKDDSVKGMSADAFKNVMYCLVATPANTPQALNALSSLVTAVGAKPYFIDAAEHDSFAAGAAHLPLLASLVLMHTVSHSPGWREMQPIAGEGLVATTALAAATPDEVARALHSNRAALRHWIAALQQTLDDFDHALDAPHQLAELAATARDARDAWLSTLPHERPGEGEQYSDVTKVENPLTGMFFGRRTMRKRN